MKTEKVEHLRVVIADEGLPLAERKTAAERYIAELADAVPAPADDDPAVIELVKPRTEELIPGFWSLWVEKITGHRADAFSLPWARRLVYEKRQNVPVLAVVVDEDAHQLERLAACQWLRDNLPHIEKWKMNNYTAERMLAEVLAADGFKWTSSGKFPVQRPPQTLHDLWTF